MTDRKDLFAFVRPLRIVCWFRGHDFGFFESVPRGGWFYCFRCGLDVDE